MKTIVEIRQGVAKHLFPTEAQPKTLLVDEGKLGDAAKWMAGSFTLLTAVLTFFGITGGVLDRILRTYPRHALFIFCLVGVAVAVGVLAPVLKSDQRVATWVVIAAIASAGAAIWVGFPDLPATDDSLALGKGPTWFAVGLLLAAAVFLWKSSIPLITAALIVGIAFFGFGIYGAAKLSVMSKGTTEDPQLSADTIVTDGSRSVKITAVASRLDGHYLVIQMSNPDDPKPGTGALGTARLSPDASGALDRTVTFPLGAGYRSPLVIAAAKCPLEAENGCPDQMQEQLRLDFGSQGGMEVGGSLVPSDDGSAVVGTITASGLPSSGHLRLTLLRRSASGRPIVVATGTGTPDTAGSMEWTAKARLSNVRRGKFRLIYRACNGAVCESRIPVATYRHNRS